MPKFKTFRLNFFPAYLLHQLGANNRHGIHSPFVYHLVDEVIYGTKAAYGHPDDIKKDHRGLPDFMGRYPKRVRRLIIRLINHFGDENVLFYNAAAQVSGDIDLSSTSVLIVANIYQDKKGTATWEALKQTEAVTVSIGMFWFGLLFFKTGQARQHFKIRYW